MSNFSCSVQFYWISLFSSKYFVRDCRFSDVFPRNNLPKIKDGAYIINLDNKKSKRINCFSLFINRNTTVYCDSFSIEYIPLEVLNKIKDKSITYNIFRIQDNESIMAGFYFIEYRLAAKTLFRLY